MDINSVNREGFLISGMVSIERIITWSKLWISLWISGFLLWISLVEMGLGWVYLGW